MLKFKRFLIGQEFTWMTDCSGLVKFFETDYEATHTTQRWKLELLQFDFTIVHRPGQMLADCDMLSRHNTWTNEWHKEEGMKNWMNKQQRKEVDEAKRVRTGVWDFNTTLPVALLALISADETEGIETTPLPIPRMHENTKIIGANIVNRTSLAAPCNKARNAMGNWEWSRNIWARTALSEKNGQRRMLANVARRTEPPNLPIWFRQERRPARRDP
jgi:hypothetical protein